MHRYVALLRGINVGGKNLIKMADLRAAFEALGAVDVATYIQSGNVVFSAKAAKKAITNAIEEALSEAFAYESRVVVVTGAELQRVVEQAPKGFGEEPDEYHYDVLFVKEPLTAKEALAEVPTNPEVDEIQVGDHALYFRRLAATAAKSHLPKLSARKVYQSLTVRNWRTTTKLLEMILAS